MQPKKRRFASVPRKKNNKLPIIISPPRYLTTEQLPVWWHIRGRSGELATRRRRRIPYRPGVVTHLKMIRHTRTQGPPLLLLVAWHKLEAEDGRRRTVLAWSVLFQLAARKKEIKKKKGEQNQTQKHKRHERERVAASAKKHCGNGLG